MKPRTWGLVVGVIVAVGAALLLFGPKLRDRNEFPHFDPDNPAPYKRHLIKTELLPQLTGTDSWQSKIAEIQLSDNHEYFTDEDCERVFAALSHELRHVRQNAVGVCSALGTRAQPAVNRLIDMLSQPEEEPDRIARILVKGMGPLGDAEIARLAALYANPIARPHVLVVLRKQGPRAGAVVPLLLEELRRPGTHEILLSALEDIAPDTVPEARRKARIVTLIAESGNDLGGVNARQEAFARLIEEGKGDPEVVSHLLAQVTRRTWFRRAAIRGLGKSGTANGEVIKVLVQILIETNRTEHGWQVDREAAVKALADLTPVAPDAIMTEVIVLLRSEDAQVRKSALSIVSWTGALGKPAVAAVQKCLDDRDATNATFAVHALGAIGPDARSAAPALALKFQRHPTIAVLYDELPGWAERDALRKMGAGAVPVLVASLSDPAPQTRRAMLEALVLFGESAKPAVPDMIACLADQDERVRGTAIVALSELSAAAPTAVASLTRQLKEDSLANRVAAAQALTRFGAATREALPVARAALQHREGKEASALRAAAADLLAAMKPKEEAALTDLVAVCKDETPAVRFAAARAAWLLGKHPVVEPTMLALAKAAPDPAVAAQACAWLWREHKNREASACLLALYKANLAQTFDGAAMNDVERELAQALLVLGPEGEAAGKIFVTALTKSPALFPMTKSRRDLYRRALNAVGPSMFEQPIQKLREFPGVVGPPLFFAYYGGPAAKDAVPELIRLLKLARKNTLAANTQLIECTEALHTIGPDSKAALPELLSMWKEASWCVKSTIDFERGVGEQWIYRLSKIIPAIDPVAAKEAGIP